VTRLLLVAAGVHRLDAPAGARAVLLDGDRISWVGDDPADAPPHDRAVDLGGAWITPAFVDAHVHATLTGLALTGVPLADATSAAEVLDRVRRHRGGPEAAVLGAGWDDFGWTPRRLPSADELSEAAGGRTVLLARVDGHSCLVDATTLTQLPLERLEGVDRDARGEPTGWLREESSEAALTLVRAKLTEADLATARDAACATALALGIGSIHEMGHPGLSGIDDAIVWNQGDWPLEVITWWAELDLDAAVRHGLRPGGDLFLDGSIGSCTAATHEGYGPAGENGLLFHADDAVAEWFSACTAAGLGGGVHAIGGRAIEQALPALESAEQRHGLAAVRRARHRIEHVELPSREQVRRMGRLGVVASVQPAFDAVWGGDDGLYAERFGVQAARDSNPFAWFAQEGVPMAFGSDSTVTPLDPLGGVRAAVAHRGGHAISRSDALAAHTRGGHHVAGTEGVGDVAVGQRADLAVWSSDPLTGPDAHVVHCLATVVRGSCAHGALV
jgi:predicted amidohydrolase YtcJ